MIAAGERTGSVRPAKLFSSQPPHPMSQILPLSMSEADIDQVIDGLCVREKASECGGKLNDE
jgi:hypothetical protein